MNRIECFSLFLMVCTAMLPLITDTRKCYHSLVANSRKPVTLTLTNMTSQGVKYCVLEVKSKPGSLLSLQIFYVPHNQSAVNCSRDYLHVGNDEQTIGKHTMTSYKYCRVTVEEEVVSRGNYLWVVFKRSFKPALLELKLRAQSPVNCNDSHFRCSPVQCISKNKICDGRTDCRNGRDEFCKIPGSSNEVRMPCFRCKNGTCINPRLQRYDANWGVKLWYLCDGYNHCPDGTDERKDICVRLKGRLNSVFQCVPRDVMFGPNTSVLMWNTVLCNNKKECFHGEDESPEQCSPKTEKSQLYMNVSAIISVIAFLAVVIAVAVFLLYLEKRRRLKQTEPEIQTVIRTDTRNAQSHETVALNSGLEQSTFDSFGIRQTVL